jgi:hypothetical protein
MNNVYSYNPHFKDYKTNPYSDYTFWEKLDSLAGGKQLSQTITPEQEAAIVAATNKQNVELTTALTAAQQSVENASKNKKQLYIAFGIIGVLIIIILFLKKRHG